MNDSDPLVRLLSWVVRRLGLRTLLVLTLLSTSLGSAVFGLAGVIRGLDFSLLVFFSLTSLLLSGYLAGTRLPGWAAGATMLGVGAAVILIRLGRLELPLLHAASDWASLLWQGWPWRPVSWNAFLAALETVQAPALVLVGRLSAWIAALAGRQPAFDPAAASLVWSYTFWGVSAWAAWAVRRWQRPLLGLVPSGALLAIGLNLTRGGVASLLLFLGATLLLCALVDQGGREQSWQERGIDYSEDILFDFSLGALMLVIVLITAAALAPSLSVRKIVEQARRLAQGQTEQVGRVGESLGLERQPQPGRPAAPKAPGLPRSHLLRAGPELSRQVVLRIATGELPPGPPGLPPARPVPRYYWRGLTYDLYTGRGWATSQTSARAYPAGEPAAAASRAYGHLVQQSVELVGRAPGEQVVYAAGQLANMDHDYRVEARAVPVSTAQGLAGGDQVDLFGALVSAQAYRAASWVPEVSADELRQAGQSYPAWIRTRYLALPETVPGRLLTLARDLTATQPTPYDRAKAIETYLRTFPYTLDLPSPPAGRDVVDIFLFTLKRGYCDYYASAMVVLARAAGLPARLVIGYAAGTYDPVAARYIVTEAEAHSWPEIYFPGYGWIEFEPTAGQPALQRPDAAGSGGLPELGPGEQTSAIERESAPGAAPWRPILLWFGALLAAAGLGFFVKLQVETWRLAWLAPTAALADIYRGIYRRGRSLSLPAGRGATPYEYSASLSRHLAALSGGKRWERFLAPASQELRQLAELYSRGLYSLTPPTRGERGAALRAWRRLRWRLWLARLL